MSDARRRMRELEAKVDGFFARVRGRHAADMRCGAGCSACCQAGLSVTALEAAAVEDALAALPSPSRAALRARAVERLAVAAEDGGEDIGEGCVALEPDGRCAIYDGRPLVCRSHGVPIRVTREQGAVRLPMVEVCELNFTGGFDAVAADEVLDQTTLSTVVAALDAAYAAERAAPRGERIAIVTLLAASVSASESGSDSDSASDYVRR